MIAVFRRRRHQRVSLFARRRPLLFEPLERRLALFTNGLETVAELTVFASATSPEKTNDYVRRQDGAAGGTVSIITGTPADTGDGLGMGSFVDVNESLPNVLTSGDYKFRQIAPKPGEEVILRISGDVTLRTQYVFRPTRIIGEYNGSTPPKLTVYAGQTLWVPPPDWQGDPRALAMPHAATIDLQPDESEVSGSAVAGGSFTFVTTASGGVDVTAYAAGSWGADGGTGGKGGTITVLANRQVAGGKGERANVSGQLSVDGGWAFTACCLTYPEAGSEIDGARGGEGGTLIVGGATVDANLFARGGGGGSGSNWLPEQRPTTDPRDGRKGGQGGRGGVISIDYDYLASSQIRTTGGSGGRGGYGAYPGLFAWGEPFVTGGDGGRGGDGGAGGAVLLNGEQQFDQGGNGGNGGRSGRGSYHELCSNFGGSCFEDAGMGGAGGDGGSGGSAGEFNLQTISIPGRINAPLLPTGATKGGEGGEGQGWYSERRGAKGKPGASRGAGTHPSTTSVPLLSPPPKSSWTILVYSAADDTAEPNYLGEAEDRSIEQSIVNGLAEFESRKLAHSSVNIVMQMDRIADGNFVEGDSSRPIPTYEGSDWEDTRRGKVEFSPNRDHLATYLAPLSLPGFSERNTGDKAALVEFLKWGINAAPAENYVLVIQGHGAGPWGFLHDETGADVDELTPRELREALTEVPAGTIDLMIFDTCTTQTVELTLELAGLVPLVVGPQGYTGGYPGHFRFHHDEWIAKLRESVLNEIALSPLELGKEVLNSAPATLNNGNGQVRTASLIDTSQVRWLKSRLEDFAQTAVLTASGTDWTTLAAAVANSPMCHCGSFGGNGERDLAQFMQYVSVLLAKQNPELAAAANEVLAALAPGAGNLVIQTQLRGGISIYMPGQGKLVDADYNYPEYRFLEATPGRANWRDFLEHLRVTRVAGSTLREAGEDWGDRTSPFGFSFSSNVANFEGTLQGSGDTDTLSFTVVANQTLAIYLSGAAVGMSVMLTDEAGREHFRGVAPSHTPKDWLVSLPSDGRYYLSSIADGESVGEQSYAIRLQIGRESEVAAFPIAGQKRVSSHFLPGALPTVVVDVENFGGASFTVTQVALADGTAAKILPSISNTNTIVSPGGQASFAVKLAGEVMTIVADELQIATTSPSIPLLTVPVRFVVHDTAIPWRNPTLSYDTDDDQHVAPKDVLTIINDINAFGSRRLATPTAGTLLAPFLDVTGDNYVAPNDALSVINHLNAARFLPEGDGEANESRPAFTDAQLLDLLALDAASRSRRKRSFG